ncbi:MAG TPA: efflux RND transporter periplasmic adaptor subunit [Gammaproteobacteria bacterium]
MLTARPHLPAALLVLALLSACQPADTPAGGKPEAAATKGPPPVAVETVTVATGQVSATITAVGTLQADESVVIRPEIAGLVTEISFAEGRPVERGATLVRLDDSILRAELAQAEADLAQARREYERNLDLFKKGSGSARARDEATAALEVNTARIALARARLDKTRIRAPFGGLLGLRAVSVGDYVTPGQALVNLEDVDPVKVDFRVPEVFLARLRPGQQLSLEVDAFPGQAFSGEVYALDPRIDAEGRSIALRARIDNLEGVLRPGLFARVQLVTARRDDALLVPEEAVFARGEQLFVYRVVDGKAVLTPVRLGTRQGAKVEVAEGLAAGEQVVSAGHHKLRPGAPVRPVNAG